MQGRLNESFPVFAHVVGPAAAYSNIGVLLTRQGRAAEAREHFQRALALDNSIHPAAEFLVCLAPSLPQSSESPRNDVLRSVGPLAER
jgi:tetratricopeptide (TPR) repeat protein